MICMNLDMHSFIWSRIESSGLIPNCQYKTSLIPVTVDKVIFYGDFTRSFDMKSHRWREHVKNVAYGSDHTGTTGLSGSAIILSIYYKSGDQAFNPVMTVRFEPKSLQQLAMQMVYHEVEPTHWDMLPDKLKCKMMLL